MKRYMICPIIGDGLTTDTAYRSAASDLSDSAVTSVIPGDPLTGAPLYGFCFCRVGRVNFGPVYQLTNAFVFPDYPLDARMDGMEPSVRAAMNQSVEAYDLDGNGLNIDMSQYGDADSYESVLLHIYQTFNPLLTLANFRTFDVSEGE